MSNIGVHFSSESETWETPRELFDKLNEVWDFTLDPACFECSAKCEKFYTPTDDGLSKDWSGDTFYLNPPYGRVIKDWMKKAKESFEEGGTGVCLIPSRTDTQYVHEHVFNGATAICFMKGRIKFENYNSQEFRKGQKPMSAPFPSMLAIYDKDLCDKKLHLLNSYGKVVIL